MSEIRERVGARIRELRVSRHLTQEQLAERAGLTAKSLGEIERGTGNPTIETLASLAEGLQVDLVEIVRLERPPIVYGQFSPTDVAVMREALEGVIERLSAGQDAGQDRDKE